MTTQPTGRPRKERKENADKRRRQVLSAAHRSIVQNGLTKTTLATVAAEAGLSQGVAVFYFKSKGGLLTEALRDHYRKYHENWHERLDRAGPEPIDQLIALISADFSPEVCNPDALSIWFAFWSEQLVTPQYADITQEYSSLRDSALREVMLKLMPDAPARARDLAEWTDTLTDGYWQSLYLSPTSQTPEQALERTFDYLATMLPEHAARLRPATK